MKRPEKGSKPNDQGEYPQMDEAIIHEKTKNALPVAGGRMNRPLTTSNAESVAEALQFAQAAADYLSAKQKAAIKRRGRNEFLDGIGYERSEWEYLLNNPIFLDTTAKPLEEYKAAQRLMYNAERRMMTRYRRINQGVA